MMPFTRKAAAHLALAAAFALALPTGSQAVDGPLNRPSLLTRAPHVQPAPSARDRVAPAKPPRKGLARPSMASGLRTPGLGVVELTVLDQGTCTAFQLNRHMLMTAAHCVYSGSDESTQRIQVRTTDDGSSWRCISGSGGSRCDGWMEVRVVAWDVTNPADFPSPSSDFAIIYTWDGFTENAWSIGFAPGATWTGAWFLVRGTGSSDRMLQAEGNVDWVAYGEWGDVYDGMVDLCGGDSGAPAFAWNNAWQQYMPYASGMATAIDPRTGNCAGEGQTMRYHAMTPFTIEAVNWVVTQRLGQDWCPQCLCKDMGAVYPGSGLDGYYWCDYL